MRVDALQSALGVILAHHRCQSTTAGLPSAPEAPLQRGEMATSANCRRMQCNKPREQLVSKLTRLPHRWSRAATVAR